ncbi:MAG: hypothetical protein ABIG85_06890 [Chloroflexota bacterium]
MGVWAVAGEVTQAAADIDRAPAMTTDPEEIATIEELRAELGLD